MQFPGGIDVIVSRVKEYFDLDAIYSNRLVFENDVLVKGTAVVNPHEKGLFPKRYCDVLYCNSLDEMSFPMK